MRQIWIRIKNNPFYLWKCNILWIINFCIKYDWHINKVVISDDFMKYLQEILHIHSWRHIDDCRTTGKQQQELAVYSFSFQWQLDDSWFIRAHYNRIWPVNGCWIKVKLGYLMWALGVKTKILISICICNGCHSLHGLLLLMSCLVVCGSVVWAAFFKFSINKII